VFFIDCSKNGEEHASYKFLFRFLFGYLIFDVLLHFGAFA